MSNFKENMSTEKKEERFLGMTADELRAAGATHTAKEINQQPALWLKTWSLINQQQKQLKSFLDTVFAHENLDIILAGAGTSAFIGMILSGPFQRNTRQRTRAVATTDLLSHPGLYFERETPVLLVSFARSGNSPESVAAVELADSFCRNAFHLIITCNESGKLAVMRNTSTSYLFLLPEEADDKSLAMTGSFTTMLLAGYLISGIDHIERSLSQVKRLAKYGEDVIKNYAGKLREVANLDFQRAVFLGSGPLQGTAKESYLKLQELTDGKVICSYDSFLGFRHGPKVVINPSSLLVYLFTNDDYAHQYEIDLVRAVNAGERGLYSIGIFETAEEELDLDLTITLTADQEEKIEEDFLSVCSVLPAQMIGFFKSIQLGLAPDNPSLNGTITRVVTGVNIYDFPEEVSGPGIQ